MLSFLLYPSKDGTPFCNPSLALYTLSHLPQWDWPPCLLRLQQQSPRQYYEVLPAAATAALNPSAQHPVSNSRSGETHQKMSVKQYT